MLSLAALASVFGGRAASAQWARQTSLDVGAIHLTRDDFPDTDGVNVAAVWNRWSERIALGMSGAATRGTDDRATGFALGTASYGIPWRRARIEGGGVATLLGTTDERPASSWTGFGRLHLIGRARGAWVGASGGRAHHDASTIGGATGELGLWARHGDHRLALTATGVRTSLVTTVIFDDGTVLRERDPVGYSDVTLGGHGGWGRFEADVVATTRHTWKGDLASTPTASVGGTWWATPFVAVTAGIGRQLADPMRGTARARYATIGLRLSAERHAPSGRGPVIAPGRSGGASLAATRDADGSTVVRVHAPAAERVELMGDLTEWAPRVLVREGATWVLRLTSEPGAHHILVRLDGGPWMPPSNLPRLDDELGGTVGLLVIP